MLTMPYHDGTWKNVLSFFLGLIEPWKPSAFSTTAVFFEIDGSFQRNQVHGMFEQVNKIIAR